MSDKKRELVETSYTLAHSTATALIADIGQLLADKPAPGGPVAINWGHVGELNEVVRQLLEVRKMLAGEEQGEKR
jgi:hypothetical protein